MTISDSDPYVGYWFGTHPYTQVARIAPFMALQIREKFNRTADGGRTSYWEVKLMDGGLDTTLKLTSAGSEAEAKLIAIGLARTMMAQMAMQLDTLEKETKEEIPEEELLAMQNPSEDDFPEGSN